MLKKQLTPSLESLAALEKEGFANVPLTKLDAATARKLILKAHGEAMLKERAQEVKDKVIKDGELEMKFELITFGKKPRDGYSLWISMHGGGGAPAAINDQQWENQKRLYQLEEGIYVAPRAPTNTWNLWHEGHIDTMFNRLIADLIVTHGVNPNRVYLLGYSAGGDGVYQLAPRMADRWAAASMMAGHPNGVSLLSLRNTPFSIHMGGNDGTFDRNKVAAEYGKKLDELQKTDPAGYVHDVQIYPGKGHWMDRLDAQALPWMAKFTRDPLPQRIVWQQTGTPHQQSYWLAVPADEAKNGSLVVATREGQKFDVSEAENVTNLLIRLDDRMVNLDKPIEVKQGSQTLFQGEAERTIGVMLRTLLSYGDPLLMFNAEVQVKLAD
ncbi:dienelactone hydrolase family protein [Blastopirellula retiformator]|uniref:Alpha/beta hydrolase family protein n=1 Tax=Blastopirellula retiformator TaxID=2527970 RepID=A0A5C5V1Z8_9BACT|nr:dienelactone hydrolase family protein [Blastopirellula retiformator]TWT32624.1 Alpha/beta hydrolase family protein [Blastopirellula retiformator]